MALVLDSGVLYASMDRSDRYHEASRVLIEGTAEPLVIPLPVLVEVDYWVDQRLFPAAFVALLRDIESGSYRVEGLSGEDLVRVREICDRYGDSRVGFVDAAVLAVVERLREPKLATLDQTHFRLMRPRHVDALTLLPEP